jgi:hypothetical protein
MAKYSTKHVSAKRYTVKGIKVPKIKVAKLSGTTFRGLKSGKTTSKVANPLSMKIKL